MYFLAMHTNAVVYCLKSGLIMIFIAEEGSTQDISSIYSRIVYIVLVYQKEFDTQR